MEKTKIGKFLDILGMREQPFGIYYSDTAPEGAISPKPSPLPSIEMEAKGQVDWKSVYENWSCVIGILWRARNKGVAACFDREHFGCLGGAFYLGYLKPQLEAIVYYVSTGAPGQREGEHYFESPEITRKFFETMDPRPAPGRYCIFKPINTFSEGERPELVVFFARAEAIAGLNQLATFVTNDFEAVRSPFGAGCTNIITWPLKYLAQGELKAVIGGWDPSDRKFMKPDELTFSVPREMFERMVNRWKESFLTTDTWAHVRKRIERSRKAWGEE
jgi:uncharacterized protein (DUF169 family)